MTEYPNVRARERDRFDRPSKSEAGRTVGLESERFLENSDSFRFQKSGFQHRGPKPHQV